MAQKKNNNRDLPSFAPGADEIRKALIGVTDDRGIVDIFSPRIARTLTMLEAGFAGRKSPLGAWVFEGPSAMPIHLLVETLGEHWLGETWDGSPPFVYIDCNGYSNSYPGVLSSLLGPIPHDQFGRQVPPLFSRINYPHFYCLAKDNLEKLWGWKNWFEKTYQEDIQRLRENASRFYLDLENLALRQESQYYKELEKKNGFLSLIFFDAVDRAAPELINVIRQILHRGSVIVWPGHLVDFSRATVIMSIYRDESANQLGFRKTDGADDKDVENRRAFYHNRRSKLLRHPQISGLIQDIGENLIILGETTLESQKFQLTKILTGLKKQFQDAGINIKFSPAFIEKFCLNSRDPGLNAFTNARLRIGVDRHILFHIASLVVHKKIRKGARLLFEPKEDVEKFQSLVVIEDSGKDEEILPQEIRKISPTRRLSQIFFRGEEDIKEDENIRRLHERAESILKRLAS